MGEPMAPTQTGSIGAYGEAARAIYLWVYLYFYGLFCLLHVCLLPVCLFVCLFVTCLPVACLSVASVCGCICLSGVRIRTIAVHILLLALPLATVGHSWTRHNFLEEGRAREVTFAWQFTCYQYCHALLLVRLFSLWFDVNQWRRDILAIQCNPPLPSHAHAIAGTIGLATTKACKAG